MCKGQTVECMAVYRSVGIDEETVELWIGSGDASGQSQISWLALIGDGSTVCFNRFIYAYIHRCVIDITVPLDLNLSALTTMKKYILN